MFFKSFSSCKKVRLRNIPFDLTFEYFLYSVESKICQEILMWLLIFNLAGLVLINFSQELLFLWEENLPPVDLSKHLKPEGEEYLPLAC